MNRQTLRAELDRAVGEALTTQRLRDAVDRIERPYVEIVHAVALTDYASTTDTLKRLESRAAVQEAEIAQLRMLLREAHGQLERHHTVTRTTSSDYRRLSSRIAQALEHTTVEVPQ